jgi:hypothetical protein
MATRLKLLSPAEHLEQRIKELDAEVERIRAEEGDPAAALGTFLRDWIGLDALEETYAEYLRHEDSFLFDDYDDERGAGEDEDGRERR